MAAENKIYNKGHFITLYMSIFMVTFSTIFLSISIALENFAFLGVGPAIGLGVGIAIGTEKENELKKQGRLINEEEKVDVKKLLLIFGITALLLITIFLSVIFFD